MGKQDMIIENRNKEMSLLGLFGRENLSSLQKRIADVTDFSFSTIDYKGEKVVPSYRQEKYRNYLNYSGNHAGCQMTEAFASARAAINNKPFIFECQCGLTKIAVPVIVNKQYMGAFLCGGVRCKDPDALDPITGQNIIQKDFVKESHHEQNPWFEQIPEYSASRIRSVADLLFHITTEMCDKENYALRLGNSEHNTVHIGDLRRKNNELRAQIKKLELQNLRTIIHPQILLNMLVTLSSSSIIENAPVTQGIVENLSSFLRYYLEYSGEKISLEQEILHIKEYLDILKKQYRDRVEIKIRENDFDSAQMVPKLLLFPLIEYLVNFGILNQNAQGILSLVTEYSIDRCVIFLKFDHSGDDINSMGYLKESGNVLDERMFLEQINQLEKRIDYEYDGDYKLSLDSNLIIVDIPKTITNNEEENHNG